MQLKSNVMWKVQQAKVIVVHQQRDQRYKTKPCGMSLNKHEPPGEIPSFRNIFV